MNIVFIIVVLLHTRLLILHIIHNNVYVYNILLLYKNRKHDDDNYRVRSCACGDNAITRVREHARAGAGSVITRCQTMAYHKAVAIINNVGGPRRRRTRSERARARPLRNERPRRVWRGGRLLSSGRMAAVHRDRDTPSTATDAPSTGHGRDGTDR